jgi:ubiquinone biosynthesis protein
LNIEGIGRELYPELDLWKTAKPFLERWMDERVGLQAFIKGIRTTLPLWAEKLPEIPMLIHEALVQQQEKSEYLKRLEHEMTQLRQEKQQQHERLILVLIGSTLVISATIIMSLKTWPFFNLNALLLGMILGGMGGIMFLLALGKTR